MSIANTKLPFASDYMESAHPNVLAALAQTANRPLPGYGLDPISEAARERIRAACAAPLAAVHFLAGGTQANATVIDALLAPYQGVVAAETGHIASHEAGAIEAAGHKVLTLPARDGKICAAQVTAIAEQFLADENRDHMVMPGLVYLSQPTEFGTVYTLGELEDISAAAHAHDMRLYVDGARLAYALASDHTSVTLADLARLADAFYLGGTKCGALFGEAVVVPQPGSIPHLFTIIKQHGALLAKGWAIGAQFDALLADDLYARIGTDANRHAKRIARAFEGRGMLATPPQTNQVFAIMPNQTYRAISEFADISFWDRPDDGHTMARIATSWATRVEDVDAFIALLR